MKLYLISRTDEIDHDEYIEFVVAAKDEESALKWNPDGSEPKDGSWGTLLNPVLGKNLKIECIGESNSLVEKVIISSFNAG